MGLLKHASLLWAPARHQPHRRMKLLLGSLLFIAGMAVLAQLWYPRDLALPRATLAGRAVGGKRYDELVRRITADFESSQVTVRAGDLSSTLPLRRIGAVLETAATANQAIDYPLWQRLVPFSLLFKRPHVDHMVVSVNDEQLSSVTDTLTKELSRPPEDAGLAITDGKLVTTSAKTGQGVTTDAIVAALSRRAFGFGTTTIVVDSEPKEPALTDDDITPIRAQAEAITKRPIVVVAPDGREFTPEPGLIASWLMVAKVPESGLELQADEAHLQDYATELNKSVGVTPGTVRVTLVDGEEKGRTEAPSGLTIASDELIADIKREMFDQTGSGEVVIGMVSIPPVATYDRSYTSSQKGLRAYVDHVTRSEDVRIAVTQLGGSGWSARGRAGEQLPSASTYKLYVSYMLFRQIATGKLSWSDGMLDTDVAGCFERMIVVSDNACAETFIDRFGATNLNNFLYDNGISRATTFTSKDAAQTSAADLEKLLMGIENGSKISGSERSRLLSAMGRQKYRAGIPAGSSGKVEDKVGFLWDYLHDAAIVRHPKGTYSLVIMTKNSSWGRIAQITREIEHILYP